MRHRTQPLLGMEVCFARAVRAESPPSIQISYHDSNPAGVREKSREAEVRQEEMYLPDTAASDDSRLVSRLFYIHLH
jgi:hypothetical protein